VANQLIGRVAAEEKSDMMSNQKPEQHVALPADLLKSTGLAFIDNPN
jgi:hypothetical protein